MIKAKKQIWQQPWNFTESFLIAFGLMISGFLIEISINGKSINIPEWPGNIIILISYILILFSVNFFLKKTSFVKWLTSVPASISAISIFAFLVLLMGVFPQNAEQYGIVKLLGIYNITNSWAYLLIMLYFSTCLGLVILKKFDSITKSNIGFFLNHAGLWIAIVAGSLGSSDVQILKMTLHENEFNYLATDSTNTKHELPFGIKLLDFSLEEYEAKIGVLNYQKSKLYTENNNLTFYANKGITKELLGNKITVLKYFPTAGKVGDRYEAFMGLGAPPAALVEIENIKTKQKQQKWLTCGNFMYQPEYYKFDSTFSLIMIPPEPKNYSSKVIIVNQEINDTISIEVNKPYEIDGWKIYQLNYNEPMGRYSETSIFEFVKDTWLPIIYIGIFMMMAGAGYIFWTGKKEKIEQ